MSKICSCATNEFCEAVGNKLEKNTKKIKVSLSKQLEASKELLKQDELEALKEASKKMEKARNLSKDIFIKK